MAEDGWGKANIGITGIGETCVSDEKDLRKVISLQRDREVTIKQALSEIYNAIYLLTLATDLEDIEMQDSEIENIENDVRRDLILLMKEIRGYADKASFAFSELVKKHQLDDRRDNKE